MNLQTIKQSLLDYYSKGTILSGKKTEVNGSIEILEPRYYGDNGARDPIGLFIPEAVYDPVIEDMDAADVFLRYPDIFDDKVSCVFLQTMQQVHDGLCGAVTFIKPHPDYLVFCIHNWSQKA